MHTDSTILVTGASGFVGRSLANQLIEQQTSVICTSRNIMQIARADCRQVAELGPDTDWRHCLSGVQTVVHCAARVHVMHDTAADPLQVFRQVNVAGTLRLAEQAAAAGVQQFIFLSSVKVNGEQTFPGAPYSETDMAAPSDPYGISKHEAEQALLEFGRQCGMAITIIRPPLVYGPGVGANFLSLLRAVKKQLPLPLASIRNQRSLVYVKNLVSLIIHCIDHPQAVNQIFMVSDDHDLSTPELLRQCAKALNVPSRLLPCPLGLLTLMARLLGKKSVADRLCQSLQVDISKAKQQLGWAPPYSVQQGLLASVKDI
jgi:nucleoside-diphosphate-sugar epimerase